MRINKSFPVMERDNSYPKKEFIPAAAYNPTTSGSRSNDPPAKVVKDPRFKFASQSAEVAPAQDAVGFVYERMRPLRGVGSEWDRNGSLRQQSPFSGSDSPPFEQELPVSGRSHPLSIGAKYDVIPPGMPPIESRRFEDGRGGYEQSFYEGHYSGNKGPMRSEEVVLSARRGGHYSGDSETRLYRNNNSDDYSLPLSARKPPLYESAVKARPFVPTIPLTGILTSRSNNLMFDVDDSDIHTTGRSNFSADNDYSARNDPLSFEMAASKAPKKSPVPPIALAGLTSRSAVSQYDYDEPIKSDRFLDLSNGSNFFSQTSNEKNSSGGDSHDNSSFLNLLSEPYETDLLDDHGSLNSNKNRSVLWSGRPIYTEEALSDGSHLTPRQSHTSHDSSHLNATPRTTSTPRIPSVNNQPGVRNLTYPSSLLANEFVPDDGSSGLFSGYKSIAPMPGMPLPEGFSSNEGSGYRSNDDMLLTDYSVDYAEMQFDLFGNNHDQYHLAPSNFNNVQSEDKSNEKQL